MTTALNRSMTSSEWLHSRCSVEHLLTALLVTALVSCGDRGDDEVRQATSACASDQHVSGGACRACAPGSTNEAGDDPTGPNTGCNPTYCAANERVSGHACSVCGPGTSNDAGDDASSGDTICDAILCSEGAHVVSHLCTPCAPGEANAAGDDASGADTACDGKLCASNLRVQNHACVTCPAGTSNAAGDDASGGDTECDICGDGLIRGVEVCDDANNLACGTCNAACSAVQAGGDCPFGTGCSINADCLSDICNVAHFCDP